MDTSKYTVRNTSYQNIYESFLNLFPELKQSVKKWDKDGFGKVRRTILVTLKSGLRIRFGCGIEDDDGEWVWAAYLTPSEKRCEKLGIEPLEDNADNFNLDPKNKG